jgi:mitogen-activated protein kinase kinase
MTYQSNTPPSAPEDSTDFALNPASLVESPESSSLAEDSSREQSEDASNNFRLPNFRSGSDTPATTTMTASSTPLGVLNNARRPPAAASLSSMRAGGGLPQDMQAKMRAFHASRQGAPPGGRPSLSTQSSHGPVPGAGLPGMGGLPGGLRLPPGMRPQAQATSSAPAVPKAGAKPSLGARRGMKLPGGLPGAPGAASIPGTPSLDTNGAASTTGGSMFNKFSEFVDTKNGTLKFAGKAVIHGGGIDFSNGSNFSISLDEVDTLDELGKGNYGTVYKVRHARPKMRRPGLGLAGNRSASPITPITPVSEDSSPVKPSGGTTGIIMAMKELRLELDEAKFAAIIMELDILHRCLSPYIIDFYGAFFQEGAVYICIEFMDGGSIDKIYGDGIPESVLRKITYATTKGLKELKDVHNIIHRDVKPTNILISTRGQVKICDFGVSGNLVASIAKTNIGCQSYMAPERISGGGMSQAGANPGGGTYSVQSDIWSLGLSIIECAMGRYPYPPETYNNIFSQLSVSLMAS